MKKSNTTGNMSETEHEFDRADTDSDQKYLSCNEEYDGAECNEILENEIFFCSPEQRKAKVLARFKELFNDFKTKKYKQTQDGTDVTTAPEVLEEMIDDLVLLSRLCIHSLVNDQASLTNSRIHYWLHWTVGKTRRRVEQLERKMKIHRNFLKIENHLSKASLSGNVKIKLKGTSYDFSVTACGEKGRKLPGGVLLADAILVNDPNIIVFEGASSYDAACQVLHILV